MNRVIVACLVAVASVLAAGADRASAQGDASAMVRLLKSGRLPPDRVANVVNMVCQRGTADELAFVFEQAAQAAAYPPAVRRQAIEGLATAAQTRKSRPAGSAASLAPLLADPDPAVQRAALRLATFWHEPSLGDPLVRLAIDPTANDETRRLAIDALLAMGGAPLKEASDALLTAGDASLRAWGLVTLAGADLQAAASRAATLLSDPAVATHTPLFLGAFLDRQQGTEKLAAALATATIPADTAKLVLRHMYLAGRSDTDLVNVLSKAAGIDTDRPPPTMEEVQRLGAEVLAQGDAARGESVFRRMDLGCMKCHAVSGAGGDVGPDLSPVGATSPVDYVITSILHPDLSIKESFLTRSFITSDGMIHQGIVVDRDDNRVIIKDATGQRVTVPTADIDDEVEGKSLMPKGLASFLTHAEFLDLVRFVGELGKPGVYAVRSEPTVQRWRYLKSVVNDDGRKLSAAEIFAPTGLRSEADHWKPLYARVAGAAPLDEPATDSRPLLYLQCEVDVTQEGEVEIQFDDRDGVTLWLDGNPIPLAQPTRVTLAVGRHVLGVEIDTAQRASHDLRVVVAKPTPSSAVYTVVGGP